MSKPNPWSHHRQILLPKTQLFTNPVKVGRPNAPNPALSTTCQPPLQQVSHRFVSPCLNVIKAAPALLCLQDALFNTDTLKFCSELAHILAFVTGKIMSIPANFHLTVFKYWQLGVTSSTLSQYCDVNRTLVLEDGRAMFQLQGSHLVSVLFLQLVGKY